MAVTKQDQEDAVQRRIDAARSMLIERGKTLNEEAMNNEARQRRLLMMSPAAPDEELIASVLGDA